MMRIIDVYSKSINIYQDKLYNVNVENVVRYVKQIIGSFFLFAKDLYRDRSIVIIKAT